MSGVKRTKSENPERKRIKSVADDSDVAYYRTLKSCFDKSIGYKDGTVPYKNAAIQLQIFLEDIGVDVTEDNCKKLLKASSNKSKVTFEEFLFCFETFLRNAQKAGVGVKLPTFAGLNPTQAETNNNANNNNNTDEHKKLPLDGLGHERTKSDHSGEEKKPKSARKANRKSLYDAPSSPLHKDKEDENSLSLKRGKSKRDAKKDNSEESKEEKEKRHKKRKSSSGKITAHINSPRSPKSSPRKNDAPKSADNARSEVDSYAMEEPKLVVESNVKNNKKDEVKREASNPAVKVDEKPAMLSAQNGNNIDVVSDSVPSADQPKSLTESAAEKLKSPPKTEVKVSPAFKRLEAALADEEKKDTKIASRNSNTKLTTSTGSKGTPRSTEEKPAEAVETQVETGSVTQAQHEVQQSPQAQQSNQKPAQPQQAGRSPISSRNNSSSALLPKSNSTTVINVAAKPDEIANRSITHVNKISASNNPTANTGVNREDSVNITDLEGKAANVSVHIKQLEDEIKAKSDQLKTLKDQLTWQQEGIVKAKERRQNKVSSMIQNIEYKAEDSPSQSPSTSAEFTGKLPIYIKRTHSAHKSKRIKFPKVEFVNGKMFNIAQVLKCQAIIRNHLARKRTFNPEWVLQWADSQGASKMRKRNNALKEIITTERDFVGHLNKVMEVFVRPIQKLQLLTPFELFEIFSDIEVIAALNQILLNKLEERYKEWPRVATFADIFKENAELFTLYYRYIRNFTTARTKQQEAETKYPHYTQFLKNCYEKYTGGLDVYAYLIMPVQRIMRYELLLKALLDYTEETHVDYQNLRDAIAAVQKVNRYIDERKKIDEQMELCEQRFKELIAKGGGYEVLLTQGNYAQRRFVKEFQLEAILDLSDHEKGKKNETKPELMIFSDLILASNFVHKKATLNEAGHSIPLVWIDTEFNKRNQRIIETIAAAGYTLGYGFLLNGPETSWFVKASSQAQMRELLEELAHVLKIEVTEVSTLREGFRLGCWRFVRPINGLYDGEWIDGDFHGQGVFQSPEGRVFDGYWDHTLKAGYGTITEPSKEDPTQFRSVKSGWINEHVKGIPITALDSEGANFWNKTSELTDRDLHLLTLNAQDVVYERNEMIIEQDKESGTLFLVVDGSVRIEKTTSDGNSIRLAVMGAGTLLGDSSVLPALRKATASVVADVTTKLKAVSLPLVLELFKSDPIMCARFYKHLAVKLSRRLRSLNSSGQAPPKPAPPKGISSKLSSNALTGTSDGQVARAPTRTSGSMEQLVSKAKDKEKKKKEKEPETDVAICEKFGLPAGEVFIKTTEVWVKQRGKRLGKLFISGHFVCFEFTVFGSHHKESIPILKIITLEKDKDDNTAFKIKTKNKKFSFNIEANPLDDYFNLINSLWEQAKSAEESKALEERNVTKPTLNKKFTYQELGGNSPSQLSSSGSADSLISMKSSASFGAGNTWNKLDMQEEDWGLILQGSKTITYRSGAVIIQAGTVPLRVFQIVQGKCKLEKKMPDGSLQSIGIMNTGAMFGEMSFLEGETASISVVADSKVVVYVIEGYFLNILFVRYPNLAGRFFNYLSSVIATRVSKRESALRDESESEDSQSAEKFRRSTTRPIAANVFSQGPNSLGAVQRAESKRKTSLSAINEQTAN